MFNLGICANKPDNFVIFLSDCLEIFLFNLLDKNLK